MKVKVYKSSVFKVNEKIYVTSEIINKLLRYDCACHEQDE